MPLRIGVPGKQLWVTSPRFGVLWSAARPSVGETAFSPKSTESNHLSEKPA